MTIFNMANTIRHADLVTSFSVQGYNIRADKSIRTFQESIALVHYGNRTTHESNLSLVDIDLVDNIEVLEHLNYVQPDFMLFEKNHFLTNKRETRLAGYPDLVVEVWSESDSKYDKGVKFAIYSNSNDKTEHWYIEQDSNTIYCYLGGNKLDEQSLTSPLKTIHGLEFDLTHLSI